MVQPPTVSEPPWLERLGVSYFRRLSQGAQAVDEDGVHVLNERELHGLRATSRGAIVRAGLAGALSALASAGAEVLAARWLGSTAWGMQARGWAVVGAVTAVASLFEIAFLYWDSLRSVHRLALVARLDLFASEREERLAVAGALARAALELPNAPRGGYGLDATREASKTELLVASLAYKLKTSVSSFLIKAIVRRALGRTALRGYLQTILPFVAVPVTVLWNAVVAWLVVREARLRVVGPSAARQLCGLALGPASLSVDGQQAAIEAIACSVVKTGDLHPNLNALLDEVVTQVGAPAGSSIGNPDHLLTSLAALSDDEARVILRLLAVAAIIDGRVTRAERFFLRRAFASRGRRLDEAALELLGEQLRRGQPIDGAAVTALA